MKLARYFLLSFLCISGIELSAITAMPHQFLSVVKADPNGTKEEQIQYHKNQIKKYKSAVEREEHLAQRAQSERQMSDVKQANARKAHYLKKIDEHVDAIQKVKEGRG